MRMNHPPIGLAHVGIPCKSMDESIAFYQWLGFEVLTRQYHKDGSNMSVLRNGNCLIELYEELGAQKKPVESLSDDGHVDHVALFCDDIDATYAELAAAGAAFLTQGGVLPGKLWEPRGCRYFVIKGPSGEKIEFATVLDENGAPIIKK